MEPWLSIGYAPLAPFDSTKKKGNTQKPHQKQSYGSLAGLGSS